MDPEKIGALIRTRRLERGLTQRQLAECLLVSDKAVSKWECGAGCPDPSLLQSLSGVLGVDMESLLCGSLDPNDPQGGNMKKLVFYVCPTCGNLLTATVPAALSCCGERLTPMVPTKATEAERLTVELIENDYFISSEHPMSKEHYLPFVALLTGDTLFLRRLYPEWNLQTRIPRIGHGTLLWYCSQHGLFYQLV